LYEGWGGADWVWWTKLSDRDHTEDQGVEGRIILKMNLKEICCERLNWIAVPQDRNKLWAVVNLVMNWYDP
jgi:hypothetical protein